MPALQDIIAVFKASSSATLILYADAPEYTIAHANDVFLKNVRTTLSDLVGKSIFTAFPENTDEFAEKRKKAVKHALEHALLLKKPYQARLERYDLQNPVTGEFEVHFWNTDTYPIFDDEGEVQFIVHMPSDVTDYVPETDSTLAETGIVIDQNFQHPLFNDYPDGVATVDLYGNFLSVNRNFCNLVSEPKEVLLKTSFIPFIAPDNFQKVFDIFQKATRGEIQNFEAKIITAQEIERILNITSLPILDNKMVIGIYLIAKDITDMLEAKKQLDEINKRTHTILESITDGFIAVDENWKVTYFNKEAEIMFGINRDHVIGRIFWQVFPSAIQGKFYPEYHRAMSDRVSVRFNEYIASEGMWLEVTAYPSGEGLSAYLKDITHRINHNRELEQAKERYQGLFDFSPLAKWVYDTKSLRFLAVNATAVYNYGYSQEEFLSMSLDMIWPVEDVTYLKSQVSERVKDKATSKMQARHVKKSGQVINVEIESQPLPSWGENARMIIALDVTQRIKAEEALKVSEQRFKALVQEGSDLVAIVDSRGNYTYVSPTYKKILGLDPETMLGTNVFDNLVETDIPGIKELFERLVPRGSFQVGPNRRFVANGEVRWLEAIITDLRTDPAINGIVINARDVTKRVQNEQKIKASLNHYNNTKDVSSALYVWEFKSNEVKWNTGLKEVFGHEQSGAFLKEGWFQLIHPEDRDRVVDALSACLEKNDQTWKIEYRLKAADRNYRFVLDRGFFIYDAIGQPERMVGSVKDVSERVNYLSDIEGLNKRLGEISWMQSHVVRAPLARIMGLSELLRYNEGEITQAELLSLLTDSAQELDAIIRNILQQTKDI
jgi:PAS domain S-box-containing protein